MNRKGICAVNTSLAEVEAGPHSTGIPASIRDVGDALDVQMLGRATQTFKEAILSEAYRRP
jgi:hypothetical protein